MGSKNPVLCLYDLCQEISVSEEMLSDLDKELDGEAVPNLLIPLRAAIGAVSLEDLGITLRRKAHYFRPNAITQVTVFNSEKLWIGLYCMNKGQGFPLHDHPSMTAFAYLISGRVRATTFDVVATTFGGVIQAKLSKNMVVAGPEILMLSPKTGNLHEILALEPTVMMDIFMPFYNSAERRCSYYDIVGQTEEDFFMVKSLAMGLPGAQVKYKGLPIH